MWNSLKYMSRCLKNMWVFQVDKRTARDSAFHDPIPKQQKVNREQSQTTDLLLQASAFRLLLNFARNCTFQIKVVTSKLVVEV